MGATGILIYKEAGLLNFALKHIFVPPVISGLVLKKKNLHCPPSLSIRMNRLILKKNASSKL